MERRSSKLAKAARDLLIETEQRPEVIATQTGLTVPWLMSLKGRGGENLCPQCDRVERLYEYLSGKELRF